MYGDTTTIRGRAHQFRRQATEIREVAALLKQRSDRLEWTGRSADAMRAAAQHRLAHLAHIAGLHDGAADALDRHAAAVDHLKELIAGIEHRARRLIADHLLDVFVPPLPGHADWLGLDLPMIGH